MQDFAFKLVYLLRQRINLNAQARCSLVNQVNGLVRQEAVRDVSIRERRGGYNRGVLNANAVMNFITLFQPAQDCNRVFNVRLADIDLLEATLKRCVLLNILLVLVERGRAYTAQLAARERRLQHVRRINRAFGSTSAYERV